MSARSRETRAGDESTRCCGESNDGEISGIVRNGRRRRGLATPGSSWVLPLCSLGLVLAAVEFGMIWSASQLGCNWLAA